METKQTYIEATWLGKGYGWHVIEFADGTDKPLRNLSGPYTTREQAEQKAAELQEAQA